MMKSHQEVIIFVYFRKNQRIRRKGFYFLNWGRLNQAEKCEVEKRDVIASDGWDVWRICVCVCVCVCLSLGQIFTSERSRYKDYLVNASNLNFRTEIPCTYLHYLGHISSPRKCIGSGRIQIPSWFVLVEQDVYFKTFYKLPPLNRTFADLPETLLL